MHQPLRVAALLAVCALGLGLIGWGVAASFTDGAGVSANIKVGTFGIAISSTTPNAVIDPVAKTVTATAPTIQSSAAGSAPLEFTITDTGSMPAVVAVDATSVSAPFSDLLGALAEGTQHAITIPSGGHHDYFGGLSWPTLANAEAGQSYGITYTVSATG